MTPAEKAIQLRPSTQNLDQIETVLIKGDLSVLSTDQRVQYYKAVCETVGLNPLTKPFEYITLNGKLVLYALKAATDQLRQVRGISVKVTGRETIEGVYRVTSAAQTQDGRYDEDSGAVSIGGLKGEALANALMKAETKAKRRVTLSICGLGMLDETEVEDIPAKVKREFREPVIGQNFIRADEPGPNDGNGPSLGYRVGGGQWKNRSIENVFEIATREKIEDYIVYLEEFAAKQGKPMAPWAKEFIEYATGFMHDIDSTIEEKL